ncbi:replication enhancer protein [Sweet potato leaf curl Uganda virus-[Uganda:Kampala:2008]]|uniref:Replication enhancer n=1 Tax=Sweet potato leaf curl Uganda virus-[Uganda:Kampala:2008] TaxID=940846 RepID=E8ZGG4_9GEMI|nr:replication enhancer protein [Sweet potato leaf curl Uganda virus-[Uganda:Kampala:2008]]CBY85118.1 replication enhancer protein [Sweet potato leaf curl Uganda virus-[Uganda:Kampala:2008]]
MDLRTGESLSRAQTMRALEFDNNPMSVGRTAPFHLKFLYAHQSVQGRTILKFQLQVNYRERKQLGFHKIFLQFRISTTQLTGATHSWTGILERLKWRICNEIASLGFFSLINLVYVIRHLPESVRWIQEVDNIDCKDDVKALLY